MRNTDGKKIRATPRKSVKIGVNVTWHDRFTVKIALKILFFLYAERKEHIKCVGSGPWRKEHVSL